MSFAFERSSRTGSDERWVCAEAMTCSGTQRANAAIASAVTHTFTLQVERHRHPVNRLVSMPFKLQSSLPSTYSLPSNYNWEVVITRSIIMDNLASVISVFCR